MKMTKWLALFAVLALVLAACSPADEGVDTTAGEVTDTTAGEVTDTTAGEVTATTEAPTATIQELEPIKLRYSTYQSESSATEIAILEFIEKVHAASNGAIEIEPFFGGLLLPVEEQAQGIADGRADLGLINADQYPSVFPLTTAMGIPFTTNSPGEQVLAAAEMYASNDSLRTEFQNADVIPLMWVPVGGSIVGLEEPVETWEGLSGQSIRVIGFLSHAIQYAGGNAVTLTAQDLYESLQRGLVDGYASIPFWAITLLNLHEVVPHVVDMGIGPYSTNFIAMNRSVFESLDASAREILVNVAEDYASDVLELLTEVETSVCELQSAAGSVSRLDEEEIRSFRQEVAPVLEDAWVDSVGLSEDDARGFLSEFRGVVESLGVDVQQTGVAACAEQ